MNKSSTFLLQDTSISKVTNKLFLIFWLYIINLGLVNIIHLVKEFMLFVFKHLYEHTGRFNRLCMYRKDKKKENQMVLIDIF